MPKIYGRASSLKPNKMLEVTWQWPSIPSRESSIALDQSINTMQIMLYFTSTVLNLESVWCNLCRHQFHPPPPLDSRLWIRSCQNIAPQQSIEGWKVGIKMNIFPVYLQCLHKCLSSTLGDGTQVVDKVSLGHTDSGVSDSQGIVILVGHDLNFELFAAVQLGWVGQTLVTNFVESLKIVIKKSSLR